MHAEAEAAPGIAARHGRADAAAAGARVSCSCQVQGRSRHLAEVMVLREAQEHVLGTRGGHRRGGQRAPAEPRGVPALRRQVARAQGVGRDVPAEPH